MLLSAHSYARLANRGKSSAETHGPWHLWPYGVRPECGGARVASGADARDQFREIQGRSYDPSNVIQSNAEAACRHLHPNWLHMDVDRCGVAHGFAVDR